MTTKPARREFIPAIREGIARSCPVALDAVNEIIDRWRDGHAPRHPLDSGVFGMCDHVAKDLDARADEPDEEPDPDACSNPGGHEWNRSAAEADEARISGDYANDSIRCIHCGADGDA